MRGTGDVARTERFNGSSGGLTAGQANLRLCDRKTAEDVMGCELEEWIAWTRASRLIASF